MTSTVTDAYGEYNKVSSAHPAMAYVLDLLQSESRRLGAEAIPVARTGDEKLAGTMQWQCRQCDSAIYAIVALTSDDSIALEDWHHHYQKYVTGQTPYQAAPHAKPAEFAPHIREMIAGAQQ